MQRGELQHILNMLIIGLGLLVMVGCASPPKPVATPTLQAEHSTPTTKPVLTTIPQFWTDSDFKCWTAPAAPPAVNDVADAGHLLVASGNRDDKLTVYRFDFATSQYTRLFEGVLAPDRSKPLLISPDGQRLWYGVRERDPLGFHPYTDTIYVYNLLDGLTRQVSFPVDEKRRLMASDDAIGWSPDSKCLIWWSGDTATAYRLADGAMQSKVFPGVIFGWEVSPAPTGQQWIWNPGPDIGFMRLRPEASNSIELGKFRVDNTIYYRSNILRWSGDGSTLAIVYSTEKLPYGYTNRIRLVHFADDEAATYQDIAYPATNLQWSPNGRYLLLSLEEGVYRIYDQVAEKTTEISSRHGHSFNAIPVWSPTNDQIAFVAADEHSLYVVNADGTGEKPLPAPPSGNSIFFIIWTP